LALKDVVSRAQGEAEASQCLVAEWSKKADHERKSRLDLAARNADLVEAQKTWEKQKR